MFFRIIALVVLLYIVGPGRAYSQQDSIVYQIRLGGEAGWAMNDGLYNITCTGVWYPSYVPLRLEVMAGAGSLEHETSVYFLGTRISAPLTKVIGVHIGAIMVKPALVKLYMTPPYRWELAEILEIYNIRDALCAEWGASLEFGSILQLSLNIRQSFTRTVTFKGRKLHFKVLEVGLAYIFNL